ncbi:MAG: DUF177 domain-containing protein [Bacteroidetes bacterium]|nr:DUF177 domain-containing protein [Bacteroidota bacterium]
MKHNREFEIAWLGLKLGEHIYEYSIGDAFMKEHGAPPHTSNWKAQVVLRFDRQQSFFRLYFDISGSVTVPCDRCGDDFSLQLWDEANLLIKLTGEDDEAESPDEEADVAFIPRHETVIDISSWVYEFVLLSMPLQCLHPDGQCNPEALKLLNQLGQAEDAPEHNIWNGLKDISIEEEKNTKHKGQKSKG